MMKNYPDILFDAVIKNSEITLKEIVSFYGSECFEVLNSKDRNILMLAISYGHFDLAQYMISELGVDIKIQNSSGDTALSLMIKNRGGNFNYNFMELLRGAVNTDNISGKTPLMYAVSGAGLFNSNRGNMKIVKRLLSYGADLFKKDNDGYTALAYAEAFNNRSSNYANQDIVDYLKSEMLNDFAIRKFKEDYHYDFVNGDLVINRI
jgi:ankyrin repeat protein